MDNIYPTRPCDCNDGKRNCSRCDGRGRVVCIHYSLSGKSDINASECPDCDDWGMKSCPERCSNGKVTCKACDGTGRRGGAAGIGGW